MELFVNVFDYWYISSVRDAIVLSLVQMRTVFKMKMNRDVG
jgi:hypothetical protein